jgi:gas vesicle protein
MAIVPVEKPGLFSKPSNDAAALNEGASYLGFPEKPADYAKARASFETLIKNYPKSKWRSLAETLIRLLDDLQSVQAVQARGQSEQEKLKNENERLKKEIQALNGRFQAERSALLQENEQLKKDIELLKKLEVQLDKREKMLR